MEKTTYMDNAFFVANNLTAAAKLESVAEEATELAHAALKGARLLRGENPSPAQFEKVYASIIEEYSDLENVALVLCLRKNEELMSEKMQRWVDRIKETKVQEESK